VIETQVVWSARIRRVKVAGGFVSRVRVVLFATKGSAAESAAGFGAGLGADDLDVAAAEDLSMRGAEEDEVAPSFCEPAVADVVVGVGVGREGAEFEDAAGLVSDLVAKSDADSR
jgi:hypothetical protein